MTPLKTLLTSSLLSSCLVLAAIPLPGAYLPLASFVYPVMDPELSSRFGKRRHPVKRAVRHHKGVDLAAPADSPIRAVSGGRVVFADPYAGYGNLIVIMHDKRVTTHYGHCAKIKVKPGQKVKAGQIIGTVGSTGLSTGPHLHFEIRVDGKAKNPLEYIPDLAKGAAG